MREPFRDVRPPPEPAPPPRGRGRAGLVRAAGVLGLMAAGLAGAWAFVTGVEPGTAPEEGALPAEAVRAPEDPPEPPEIVSVDTLRPGQSLGSIFRRHGLQGESFTGAVEAVREVHDPRGLRPGVTVRFAARVPERLSRVTLRLDRDRSLHLRPGPRRWRAELDSVPVTQDTLLVGGVVENSLWEATFFGDTARLAPNEDVEIIQQLANYIYPWQINFFLDLRRGDAFRVLVERDVRPDGSIRSARILAAEFFNDGRRLPAVRFDLPEGPPEYYDDEGEATRKAFLRMPLEYGRRTSGFTRRRYHPVLKRYRAHRGVDYGAPRGTPVLATGGGVVTRARRWSGYGRMVEIRHSGRFRTRYAHLSRIARGIRPGRRVEQKDVVGYVGSTGLSTAPHLHYEFLVNGRQRPPSRVDLPPGEPVPEEHRAAFERKRAERLSLLRSLTFPEDLGPEAPPAAVAVED